MRNLVRAFGVLLLALLTPSCLATSSVVKWAWDPEVRTEVLGYVESDAGATLIVILDDAGDLDDGLYELPLVACDRKNLPKVVPATFVARQLGAEEIAEFQQARGTSRRVGRLPGTYPWEDGMREHVDVFRRTAEGLRRVGPEGPRTTVALLQDWDLAPRSDAHAGQRTWVVVLRQAPGGNSPGPVAVAAIPPATVRLWRTVPAVCFLPVTFAFDVVTSPIQVVLVLHWLGEFMQQFGAAFARALWMHFTVLGILIDPSLSEDDTFGVGNMCMLAGPSLSSPLPVIIAAGAEWQWRMLLSLYRSAVAQSGSSPPAN